MREYTTDVGHLIVKLMSVNVFVSELTRRLDRASFFI
ncbi:hypothetical protein ACVWWD_005691 [Mesorhizobium sp. URHB0026]|nr:hypothetical protein X741_27870 [Mesorhizobium sp. LNHC229A00]